jgi:hypothetical protein
MPLAVTDVTNSRREILIGYHLMNHELVGGDARWGILAKDAQRNIIPPLIQERSPINES